MNDLISVIIPVKNGSKYLSEAIEAIISQNMNVEIIVVDDCSEDNTVEIAKKYNCKIVKHDSPKGQIAGKNSGLKIAQGKYILFHDHDDITQEGSLKKLYDEFLKDDTISAVEAKVQDFYSPELSKEQRTQTFIKKEPYWGLFTGAILIKKDIFDKIGLFTEGLYTGEIIEWHSKMATAGLKIKKIEDVATNRRIHSSNFGKTNRATEFKNYASILRARLASGKNK